MCTVSATNTNVAVMSAQRLAIQATFQASASSSENSSRAAPAIQGVAARRSITNAAASIASIQPIECRWCRYAPRGAIAWSSSMSRLASGRRWTNRKSSTVHQGSDPRAM